MPTHLNIIVNNYNYSFFFGIYNPKGCNVKNYHLSISIYPTHFASKTKAIVADTRGVEALVPVNPSVHPLLRSNVVFMQKE